MAVLRKGRGKSPLGGAKEGDSNDVDKDDGAGGKENDFPVLG